MLGQLPPWADGVAEADGVAVADGVLDAVTDPAVTALVGAIANAIQAAAPAPNSASTAAAPITVCLARVLISSILRSDGARSGRCPVAAVQGAAVKTIRPAGTVISPCKRLRLAGGRQG
jgi:hypothetical protein